MQKDKHILWVDDEIVSFKPHIMYLESKNYQITTIDNGIDALDILAEKSIDIVFLDQNMIGISGLETLSKIRDLKNDIPVVMITKSEEEMLMEEAIGGKITDYLIKPIKPQQILLCLKKHFDNQRLISEKTSHNYLQKFRELYIELNNLSTWQDWVDYYQKIVYWELELQEIQDQQSLEILEPQKEEMNQIFFKFIEKNYEQWYQGDGENIPIISHQLFEKKVYPHLNNTEQKTLFLVIDNMRYDQWKTIEQIINQWYEKEEESSYCSMLPSVTQYARNALFAGMTPLEIQRKTPKYWVSERDEEKCNEYEEQLLQAQLDRLGYDKEASFYKITTPQNAKKVIQQLSSHNTPLMTIVYNFIDLLSHSKTDTNLVRELAPNDKAYRSLTKSWFETSSMLEIIKIAHQRKLKLIITTDHGTVNVKEPSKIISTKNINDNIRYKNAKEITYEDKHSMCFKNPNKIGLPSESINNIFLFAKSNYFYAYQNNFNYYVSYFKNTYQHGGISVEELIIPFITMNPK